MEELHEQAAGFAPYTRGYNLMPNGVYFTTKDFKSHYEINSINDAINMFNHINIHVNEGGLNIKIEPSMVAIVPVLRTILALICKHKYRVAKYAFFQFYTSASIPSINLINLCKAYQIDYIYVADLEASKQRLKMTSSFPIDLFYGDPEYHKQLDEYFHKILEKLDTSIDTD